MIPNLWRHRKQAVSLTLIRLTSVREEQNEKQPAWPSKMVHGPPLNMRARRANTLEIRTLVKGDGKRGNNQGLGGNVVMQTQWRT